MSQEKGAEVEKTKNTAAVLREARGRPPHPRLSSTLISGSRVPSASSVGWCAEARECGSSLLHARRTSREAKKKKNIENGRGERERKKQEGRKATGRHGLCPHYPSTRHPQFIHCFQVRYASFETLYQQQMKTMQHLCRVQHWQKDATLLKETPIKETPSSYNHHET